MVSGLVVGVVVVGVTAAVVVVLLVAKYMGLWAWLLSWLRAGHEEKVQLCGPERHPGQARTYLLESDLDWLGLWPRATTYKRFTNLEDQQNVMTDDPTLPPQPLRPAPQRPSYRMVGRRSSGDGSPSPDMPFGKTHHYMDYRRGVISRQEVCEDISRSTNPFNPSWQPMPSVDSGRYMNPFRNHPTPTYIDTTKYGSGYDPTQSIDPFVRTESAIPYSQANIVENLPYSQANIPQPSILPYSQANIPQTNILPYSQANIPQPNILPYSQASLTPLPYRANGYHNAPIIDQRGRYEQHRLSYQERYEQHKYDSASTYEPTSKYDNSKYQTELFDARKYEIDAKYDSMKHQDASAYSLYEPHIDGPPNAMYDSRLRDFSRMQQFSHHLDARCSSPMSTSSSTTVNNHRLYHTIPGRSLRSYLRSTQASYLELEAKQQQLLQREKELQQKQKELQQVQLHQKQQAEHEKQKQEKIDMAIEYERRMREATHDPPPPPAPLAPAQVESQSGWSSSRLASDRLLGSSSSLGQHTRLLSPIHQISSASQSIRSLLTPTHPLSQQTMRLSNADSHLAPPPFGRIVSASPHSRSTSDIPSVQLGMQSSDSSYIRKWLGEAAALVSSVKIPQNIPFGNTGLGVPSNLSSTPPLTSALSSTPPLTDSHLSSTPPLTDSQLSLTPPLTASHMPSNSSPMSAAIMASSHLTSSGSPLNRHLVTSSPQSVFFPTTPPHSSSYMLNSSSVYRSSTTPPPSHAYLPTTPPPSAEYFPSTPPTSAFISSSDVEKSAILSADALRHSQILTSRLAEVVAARRRSWLENTEIVPSLSSTAACIDSRVSASGGFNSPAAVSISSVETVISTSKDPRDIPIITTVDNYTNWSGTTNSFVDERTNNNIQPEENIIQSDECVKLIMDEYPSLKYTPETKIPETCEKVIDIQKSSNTDATESANSFFGINMSKTAEQFQKESDWSISNRVKSIFDDIKKNAISDFINQKELEESVKHDNKSQEEKMNITTHLGFNLWSTSDDKVDKSLNKRDENRSILIQDTDMPLQNDSQNLQNCLEKTILDAKLNTDIEIHKLDEEVALTMKKHRNNWAESELPAEIRNKEKENIGLTNKINAIRSGQSLNPFLETKIAETISFGENRNQSAKAEQIKEHFDKTEGHTTPTTNVICEDSTLRKTGRDGRRGSDGGGRPGRIRGDTPPLSRESRGSFKRARRGSGEGGSPVSTMVEECIIKPRVEDEKSADEEEIAEVVDPKEVLLREGSEVLKTLKGVQSGMDSLTRLTDNVFCDKAGINKNNSIFSSQSGRSLQQRPKVLGGESINKSLESISLSTEKRHDTSSGETSSVISDDSASLLSISSDNRTSWMSTEKITEEKRHSDTYETNSKDSDKSISSSSSRSDFESESTRRVRAYLESLSVRIKQQLPYSSSAESHNCSLATSTSSRLASMSSSETPPTPARLFSYSSSETPPSSACAMSFSSSETPPNSADAVAGTPGSKTALSDTTPSSPAFFAATPGQEAQPLPDGTLQRSNSCDSLNSDSSVTLDELEDAAGQVTAQLSVTLFYDAESGDLEVLVEDASEIILSPDISNNQAPDTYVRLFLLPDKSTNVQTRVFPKSLTPTYKERFLFALDEEETLSRSLAFYLYCTDKYANSLIGEGELKMADMDLSTCPSTVSVPLTDTGQQTSVGQGEVLLSLSYLPTAERLTVVVVKAKTLHWTDDKMSLDPFVKVYIIQNGKKVMKKRTSAKKDSRAPVFNEAMIFNIPAQALHTIQLRVTVAQHLSEGKGQSIGHVILGTQSTGKPLSHWNQMMSALRKPVAMWHPLRR